MAGTTRDAAMIERLWWRAGFGPRPRDLRGSRTHADLVLRVMDLQFNSFSVRNDLRRALGLDAALTQTN